MAVLNSVLPTVAAHNLVLGGELLVSTAPGQTIVATSGSAPAASGPKTVAEALQLKTSYSFAQQSLEFAMRDLADDVKGNLKNAPFEFAIKIIGDDLKLEGITRNQSIRDFKQENQTVADILTALVRKANPVTTVKDPSEKDQKLVWLVGPDPDKPSQKSCSSRRVRPPEPKNTRCRQISWRREEEIGHSGPNKQASTPSTDGESCSFPAVHLSRDSTGY